MTGLHPHLRPQVTMHFALTALAQRFRLSLLAGRSQA